MRKIAVLLLAVTLCGCAARPIHPGAANQFDSTSYDALIVAHDIIESTKTDLSCTPQSPAGTCNILPSAIAGNVKTALNGLINAYNVADTAYQAYHSAALSGTATPAQQQAVTNGLNQVNTSTNAVALARKAQ
jgi:hypothetical protein